MWNCLSNDIHFINSYIIIYPNSYELVNIVSSTDNSRVFYVIHGLVPEKHWVISMITLVFAELWDETKHRDSSVPLKIITCYDEPSRVMLMNEADTKCCFPTNAEVNIDHLIFPL